MARNERPSRTANQPGRRWRGTGDRAERSTTDHPASQCLISRASKQAQERDARSGRVSLDVRRGEVLGIVGESGSGKTTLARCVAGLHRPSEGEIIFGDHRLAGRAAQRAVDDRRRIQIVFQNPDGSLNPRHRVAEIIGRPLQQFSDFDDSRRIARTQELIDAVRLPSRTLQRYPRELSGGEKQRVAIASALAAGPDLLICDEITSALDVSVQAAIVEMLADLQERLGTSFLFVSHDLALVHAIAERVIVLREGQTCEFGEAEQIFRAPTHAYTQALLAAIPNIPTTSNDPLAVQA